MVRLLRHGQVQGCKNEKTILLSSMLLFPFFADATGSGVDFELKSTPVPDALSVFILKF
jgi:hypothetical protein